MNTNRITILFAVTAALSSVLPAFSEGKPVSIESYTTPGYFIGYAGEEIRLIPATTAESRERTTFRIVPGLADPGNVSFQAATGDTFYLRHMNKIIWLHQFLDDPIYIGDATFRLAAGLANPNDAGLVSFESVNYRGNYIRNSGGTLLIDLLATTDEFKLNATFKITAPNWNGANQTTKIKKPVKPLTPKEVLNLVLFALLTLTAVALIVRAVFFRTTRPDSRETM